MHKLSATRFLESGKTTEELVAALLSRIADRDADVQAWAYLAPSIVLAEARRLDAIHPDDRGPLHGVPIGVKDIFYTADQPTQYNSPLYENEAPKVDSALVAILRSAGALIFGKTTTTQFASVTTGTKTRNPHDLSRTPGGSSSGSGAAVGDYQVPIALGTQTIGSIIRPASFNGIFALKPTWGAISREGVKICSMNLDTMGFFARSVQDLQLLADVVQLHDDTMPETQFMLAGSKIAFCKTHLWPKAGTGTREAMKLAMQLLEDEGVVVEELELPAEFANIPKLYQQLFQLDAGTTFLNEYIKNKDQLDQTIIEFVENPQRLTHRDHLKALDGLAELRPRFDAIAAQFDAICTPSVIEEAPTGLENTGDSSFCGMWTALHVPVVAVPGFVSNGLPVGLSLVQGRYKDRMLLDVAHAVAPVFARGGWEL
ncbi:hypothetical protein MKEN_00885300 [Mycena kentingensis (nom. inval.)]|nr:hypothetical protein MKEN_00885300 [Mycena kentingensis (nom. inval.)]